MNGEKLSFPSDIHIYTNSASIIKYTNMHYGAYFIALYIISNYPREESSG